MPLPTQDEIDALIALRTPKRRGMIHNIDEADYHRMFAFSNSTANVLVQKSPAHARDALLSNDSKDTDAKKAGTAAHALLFTPDEFNKRYAIGPAKARNTTVWKDWAAQFEHEPHRILLREGEGQKIMNMRESVLRCKRARAIIESATGFEVTGILQEENTGVLCKFRQDIQCFQGGVNIAADLKTTQSAARDDFRASIGNYRYHQQIAAYWNMADQMGHAIDHYYIIAVENEGNHYCKVYDIDADELDRGWRVFLQAAEQWRGCMESGEFPDYGEAVETLRRHDHVIAREL